MMNARRGFPLVLAWVLAACPVRAHVIGDREHDEMAARFAREFPEAQLAAADAAGGGGSSRAPILAMFERFASSVRVRSAEKFLLVESNGLPAHGMMVGITAWQQQVPLPQAYRGANAWQVPLSPVPSANPVSIRGRFLRGAIALAANGIPIFNPQNNRGEISAEIGELDQWGGHCGRADDYHYHVAPLHLSAVLGPALPVAVALDGYAIYGLADPDGTVPKNLDAFNGHETSELGYHYHASTKYPYVNGGFHGVVTEREEQVDPQPRAQGVRPAQPPLRGAKIVSFTVSPDSKTHDLKYEVGGKTGTVSYAAVGEGAWKFRFASAEGAVREETYRAEDRGAAGGREGPRPAKKGSPSAPPRMRDDAPAPREAAAKDSVDESPKRSGAMVLRSPAVGVDGVLPIEFTGDGASISPPLEWSGAPAGTRSFAVIMHHLAQDGETKWYWTLYDLPAEVNRLPKNAQGIGTLGNNSVTRRAGYAPPHSKGPGSKTYVLTVYALSAPVQLAVAPSAVNCAVLLGAMKDLILDSAELKVTNTRSGKQDDGPPERPRKKGEDPR